MSHLNPDFPYPAGHKPEPNDETPPQLELPEELKASRLITQVSMSDTWNLEAWPSSDLVMARAGLKHMLSLVEREMGQRKLMGPTR